ncbi:unnamed protein product [Durusdinium trenchii]|uniref:Dynein assembly factor 1, axonemal homolog n=1 Tax=Durusdinium trenchii TaxID=1381693 RepID=A0ABP0HTU2_9DINO
MSASDLDRALHATVLKREAVKEAEYRAARQKHEEEVRLGFGATDMTKEELKKLIDSDRRMYYRSEELNDKLFIQYKGWKELKNLEGWTGLRALYGECNAFDRISGLSSCRNLRSLFLQENCIKKIEGLEGCPLLWNLNLNNNFIERIEGLSHLRSLNTLTIQRNKIGFSGVDDLVHLVETTISTLDVQDNKIWDPDVLPEVFVRMGDLRVLYLKGNPYLDDRPVFPEDRRAAEAFNRGGLEEERAERRRIKEEENAQHERNMKAFQDMIDNVRREKRERDSMRDEDKYTNASDPVISQERRMQQQVEKWKQEHAEEIKDDAKVHAERCLRSESGDERTAKKAEPEQRYEGEKFCSEKEEDGASNDKRRLVYEDIWDA